MLNANLALLTDLYQLTMCGGYFRQGIADREAVFHLTFRRCPFGGAYAIACGLSQVIELLDSLHFDESDIAFLQTVCGNDGQPLFKDDFLQFLRDSDFCCDVMAVPEGTAVFPHEPLLRVQGPLWQCQLVETALLTIVNFQTLIATKASRVCHAADGDAVLEFGLRRAQGVDGGISASRAAYIGGCAATSNVLAGKLFDIPIRGTHAHSWVMTFEDELTAFEKYAEAMPNNCVLLVDTYDTIQGVRNAIKVAANLREQGHQLIGIRLDSGDLCELSIAARDMLDEAGLTEAAIVASNDLDEYQITALKKQGAKINVWGVGTRLSTAFDQPALGGVYKLAAIRDAAGNWSPRIKLSEQPIKVSDPGVLQIERFTSNGRFTGDRIISEADFGSRAHQQPVNGQPADEPSANLAMDYASGSRFVMAGTAQPLLIPVFERGSAVYDAPSATEARARAATQMSMLPAEVKRLGTTAGEIAEPYPVGLEPKLFALKKQLIRNVSVAKSATQEPTT